MQYAKYILKQSFKNDDWDRVRFSNEMLLIMIKTLDFDSMQAWKPVFVNCNKKSDGSKPKNKKHFHC